MFKIIVFCAAAITVINAAPREHITLPHDALSIVKLAIEKCSTVKYSAADLKLLLEEGKYVDSPEFHKIVYCVYKMIGLIKEDGTLDEEIAKKLVPESYVALITELIAKCKKNIGNPQENAAHFWQCFQTNSPVHISL